MSSPHPAALELSPLIFLQPMGLELKASYIQARTQLAVKLHPSTSDACIDVNMSTPVVPDSGSVTAEEQAAGQGVQAQLRPSKIPRRAHSKSLSDADTQ